MLVVSDVEDVFLPKPTDLLVNLQESRAALESLLGRLGDMFQDNQIVGSALGPALQAGFQLMVRGNCVADIFNLSRMNSLTSVEKSSFSRRVCPPSESARSRTGRTQRFWALRRCARCLRHDRSIC